MESLLARLRWSAYLAVQLRGQAYFPFRRRAEIAAAQGRNLAAIVRHAQRTVPYYRETLGRMNLTPADLRSVADLRRLPLIERSQLQRDPEYFVSEAVKRSDCLELRTGGSTGVPCTIYHDPRALFANAAHGERERSMITRLVGKRFGYRETVIGSPTTTDAVVQDFCARRALFPRGVRIERQYLSLLEPPERSIARINEFRPDVLRSYGSYLEVLFPHALKAAVHIHRPKVLVYSSDGLSAAVRQLIRRHFEIPVLSTYEAVEAFKIGFECLAGEGLHLNEDLYPLRIVDADGADRRDGESGDVVVSNLVNYATVLLNYRLGDIAQRLTDDPCPCGRKLARLSAPEGRNDEYLRLPSGQVIHPQAVRTILVGHPHIWRFQVVQRTASELQVKIVAAVGAERGAMKSDLSERLAKTLGNQIRIEIIFVEAIASAGSNKFRVVVSSA
ncbi:MAG TPA: hypothetical protein VEB21_21280 [Terriglobales bacterium]|nr:hypothetical protein [Terriglobales bacterium]